MAIFKADDHKGGGGGRIEEEGRFVVKITKAEKAWWKSGPTLLYTVETADGRSTRGNAALAGDFAWKTSQLVRACGAPAEFDDDDLESVFCGQIFVADVRRQKKDPQYFEVYAAIAPTTDEIVGYTSAAKAHAAAQSASFSDDEILF